MLQCTEATQPTHCFDVWIFAEGLFKRLWILQKEKLGERLIAAPMYEVFKALWIGPQGLAAVLMIETLS